MKISVIVPVYNEGASVRNAHDAIVPVLESVSPKIEYEIIFVDDGSQDDTFVHLTSLCSSFPYVRAIKLVANCGSHMAIRAGLENAYGNIASFIACDLQDPPELIPEMINQLMGQVQIVWAVRKSRQDSLPARVFARVFYGLARLMVSRNIPPTGASMFLLGEKALRAVRQYKERNLTLEGLFATMGLQQAFVSYERRYRQFGKSRWTLAKRLKLFADFFVGYSYTPIRFIYYLGMVAATLGFIYALVVVINKVFFYNPIEGYASLIVVVTIMGGLQMIMMGIIGEYVWRTLDETRSRPRYLIEKELNENLQSISTKDVEIFK